MTFCFAANALLRAALSEMFPVMFAQVGLAIVFQIKLPLSSAVKYFPADAPSGNFS